MGARTYVFLLLFFRCEKFFEKFSIFCNVFNFSFVLYVKDAEKQKMTGQKLRCNYTKIKDILTEELIMKKNICKAMVLMSVALMSISPIMAESNDDVMVISENSQAKKVDDVIIIDDGPMLGMPNPIKDFDTVEEAQKSLSFDTKVPENVPEKYKAVAFETISDKVLQVVYSDGKNEITYRTAQGTEDITGDYNKYAYTKKLKINGADVTIKGNGTKVYNVLCTKNDVTYSIFARQGISLSEIKTFLNK